VLILFFLAYRGACTPSGKENRDGKKSVHLLGFRFWPVLLFGGILLFAGFLPPSTLRR
jgi:hypothetical protein